jgi:GDP/UDP-N,N'-diacetylbacillosamine 2-epimerase (hydrolysing)
VKLAYASGSRADFGLMAATLRHLAADPAFDVSVAVTGQHLLPAYGATMGQIEGSGLRISARIPVTLSGAGGAEMALALSDQLRGFVGAWTTGRPDMVLVLGDRGEMLAASLAAVHLGIPLGHVHGGERSGTLDESFRHAISKLAHWHFPATDAAHDRLIRMGERADRIVTIGAPGLVGITDGIRADRPGLRAALARRHGLDPDRPLALVLFHPVVQQAGDAARQMAALLDGVAACGAEALVFRPNSDAGGAAIDALLDARGLPAITSLPRPDWLAALASADVLAGNSSAGIIEAASFGTPVLNLGSRQQGRERSGNVTDLADADASAIAGALAAILAGGRWTGGNIYGDGTAHLRLAAALKAVRPDPADLMKLNSY